MIGPAAAIAWVLLFLVALILSWSAGFAVRRLAPRWGLVDRPGPRKIHSQPTPLGGGLAIWLGVIGATVAADLLGRLVPVLYLAEEVDAPTRFAHSIRSGVFATWLILAAASGVMVLGLIDDRRGLGWRPRLACEVLIATALLVSQDWLLHPIAGRWWIVALEILWLVGILNSFNLLDNMDGLSAGVAAIVATILAAVLITAPRLSTDGDWFYSAWLLAIAGAAVGFLWHNRSPARLFMGDAGSYFLGFLLAAATLWFLPALGPDWPHVLLTALSLLAVPVYDTVSVVLIRLWSGRSPFVGDKCHFSHRLVELGLSPPRAVLVIYLLTLVCALPALAVARLDGRGVAILAGVLIGGLALLAVGELVARRSNWFRRGQRDV